ncbi:MAG: hypothetical protein IT329_23245 [Caldilineaceae bacterium]|nr:hypothetical protein [Caldilineaceae bacterium]
MKLTLILVTAVALTVLTATTAFAAHGAKPPVAPAPAHGSIWFGEGLARYGDHAVRLAPPPHGSIWFGGGLARFSPPTN